MKKIFIVLLICPQLFVLSTRFNRFERYDSSKEMKLERQLDLSDFETGSFGPWIDESAADARWMIEEFTTPFDQTQPAPQPSAGTKYLRVNRPSGTTGQAVLRSEPFMVSPGDQVKFNFWIRSQIIQTNNLEVAFII